MRPLHFPCVLRNYIGCGGYDLAAHHISFLSTLLRGGFDSIDGANVFVHLRGNLLGMNRRPMLLTLIILQEGGTLPFGLILLSV